MGRIVVLGAVNVDIGGFSWEPLCGEDSNPGRVQLSVGGVGHNIACGCAQLGQSVSLMTALGGDENAALVRADCERRGIDLTYALTLPDAATSCYLFIADSDGDMALAVNDMRICDALTNDALAASMKAIRAADLLILDANLPAETLRWAAQGAQCPVIADAVSAAKADRLSGALPYIDRFKPNRIEAQRLTGIEVRGPEDAMRAARALCRMGAREVYLTMGTQGVCCANGDEAFCLPGAKLSMVNATGAGDAFTAALAWSRLRGLNMRQSALAGMAAAGITAESATTVADALSEGKLTERMKEIENELEGKRQ